MAIYSKLITVIMCAHSIAATAQEANMTQVNFNTGDKVSVYKDGELLYPIPAEHPTVYAEPNMSESFTAFGANWKRNASDYEYAISDLEDGSQRFILRPGDMREGSDTNNLRERAEASGSDNAEPISGIFDADFHYTPHAYDSASWSSIVQIITDDTDPSLSYQPLIKMQHRNGVLTLDAYGPGQFTNIATIAAPQLGEDKFVRITVDFSSGYVRWALDNATMFSGQVSMLAIEGQTSGNVYFKYGAYREGGVPETVITDFHSVTFEKRS